MKWKLTIRKEIKVVVALLGLCLLIAFSERKQVGAVVRNIVIELENVHENHFLDEADILQLVESSDVRIIGTVIDRLQLRAMENKLKHDAHILDADLFTDLKGNLVVNVELRRPVARIVSEGAPDAYIAEDGTIMSISEKYTSRVVLISGPYAKVLAEAEDVDTLEEGKYIMELIEFIDADPFWKSQVAQLEIDSKGEITIYPQVTGQRVEFGKPENVETKFRKLMIFYKEILPQRGWTRYERVNLKYEGQVIAE